MAVITISRGSFSGGKIMAECLADHLSYRCVDRDVIVERAAAYGASQDELRDAMEKPPSFWDRFKHKKYMYLTLIQAALTEEALSGKIVYHGHAGHLLLRGVSHVLRARIIAPMGFRLAMTQDRLRMGRHEALAYIAKMDQDRAKWTHYLYGVNWGEPDLYDVVLNLECMDVQEACQVIADMTKLTCFEETPESNAALQNLALVSKVKANLVLHPETVDLELDITAAGDRVSIKGKTRTRNQIRAVREVAQSVPGVKELDLEGLVQVLDV